MILNKIVYAKVTVLNLLVATVVLVLAVVVVKVLALYLRRSLKDKVRRDHLEIIIKVVSYGIFAIALISVLPTLGVKLSGLLVAGGVVGLAVGFASQRVIGNLLSGLLLIIERPIKIGDQVNIDGIAGFVEDVRIISTTIRTYDGLYVRVPNEKVFTSSITNYVAHVVRRFEYVVGIRYSDDADKAIEIIKKLMGEHPLTLVNPAAQAFVDNLGDNSVNIIVRVWAPATDWYPVKMELLWKIKTALEKEGIEIAFPQRVLWFADELRKREVKNSDLGNYGSD